jgi:hypothetical protein
MLPACGGVAGALVVDDLRCPYPAVLVRAHSRSDRSSLPSVARHRAAALTSRLNRSGAPLLGRLSARDLIL